MSADVSAAQAGKIIKAASFTNYAVLLKYKQLFFRIGTGRVAEGSDASATIYRHDFNGRKK